MKSLGSLLVQARIDSVLLASAIANRLFFKNQACDPAAVRKVLVIQTRDLGDVVLTTTLLEPLRARFPNARIVLVIGEWARDLVQMSPLVDSIVPYCSSLAANFDRRKHTVGQRLRAIRQIAAERPNVIIEPRGDLGTLVAALLSGAPCRADRGTWRLGEAWHTLTARRGKRSRQDPHEADVYFQVAQRLGVSPERGRLHIAASDVDHAAVRRLLCAPDGRCAETLVALHPGASKAGKMWPVERFAALAHRMRQCGDVAFVITGSAGERVLAEVIARSLGGGTIDLCGRLTLRQLYALYGACALWIGNDTGPMHIAAAAGIPIVAFWGPLSTPKYYPLAERRLIIAAPIDGAGPVVIDRISVDQAWRQLKGFVEWARVWPDGWGTACRPSL